MIEPRTHWQALKRNWRMQCAASLILPVALVWFLGDWEPAWPEGAMLLFVVGLLSMAPTLWRFRTYKRALIEADAQSASATAEDAWSRLHHQQLMGLLHAKLPGWIGMLHYVCTAELVPLVLLVLATQGIMLLYRPPTAWVK